jgi:hypothetical protein
MVFAPKCSLSVNRPARVLCRFVTVHGLIREKCQYLPQGV